MSEEHDDRRGAHILWGMEEGEGMCGGTFLSRGLHGVSTETTFPSHGDGYSRGDGRNECIKATTMIHSGKY